MNKTTSLYLDFLRVIAAIGVFLHHAHFNWFSDAFFFDESKGHKFVAIFFVLSGYLIAYTSQKKEQDFKSYIIDRVSRLYSVVVPALILTYMLDGIGKLYHPGFYNSIAPQPHQCIRASTCILFLHQVYSFCIKPSTNGPFWSLGYEFWYYLLFGIFIFVKNNYIKIITIFGGLLIMGIKIILLFPVWLFGVAVYYASKRLIFPQYFSACLFFISLIAMLWMMFYIDFPPIQFITLGDTTWELFFSYHFVFDTIFGLITAIHIFSLSTSNIPFKVNKHLELLIRRVSSMTFSLYLYHFPLLVFFAAFFSYNKSDIVQVSCILLVIFTIIFVLSEWTEQKKFLYKKYITFLFQKSLYVKPR